MSKNPHPSSTRRVQKPCQIPSRVQRKPNGTRHCAMKAAAKARTGKLIAGQYLGADSVVFQYIVDFKRRGTMG